MAAALFRIRPKRFALDPIFACGSTRLANSNRVTHHEPIWDRDLLPTYGRMVETLDWINPGMARIVHALSTVHRVYQAGLHAHR